MFERFDDGARRVLVVAQEEARTMGHGVIDTDHLLLGILNDPGSARGAALVAAGATLTALRAEVERRHHDDRDHDREGQARRTNFTEAAKRTLEAAHLASLARGDSYIGAEHLLVGILRQPGDPAIDQLVALGVEVDRLQTAVWSAPDDRIQLRAREREGITIPVSAFAPDARALLRNAAAEADSFGDGVVEVDHVVVGMLYDGTTIAGRALTDVGLTLDTLRAHTHRRGPGTRPADRRTRREPAQFSRAVNQAFLRARLVSHRRGDPLIGTRHILLSLLEARADPAVPAIQDLGVDINALASAVWHAAPQTGDGTTGDPTI